MKHLMSVVAFGLVALSAFAVDVNEHLIFDWTPQAPADATAPLQKADFYDRINGLEPLAIYQMSGDVTTADGTFCQADPIRVVTDGVVTSATRRAAMNVPYLHMPQSSYTCATNPTVYLANQKIVFPKASVKPVGELTIFMRLRWNGFVPGADRADIFGYDYSWEGKSGVYVSINGERKPAIAIGAENPTEVGPVWLLENVWMELAFTVKTVTNEQGTVQHVLGAYRVRMDKDNGWLSYATKTVSGKTLKFQTENSRRSYLSTQDGTAFAKAGANRRNFRGDVQRIAVYDKAFTEDEMYQIMADESLDFSVGVPNQSAGEFFDANAVSSFDTETMPWRKMSANLTEANPRVTLNTTLPETTAGNARLLRFGIVGDANRSADGAFLRVSANGKKVGYVKVEQTNGAYCVCLPAALMSSKVVKAGDAYPLAITLERVGTWSGDMALDYVALCGTWQVGVFDYTKNEFGDTAASGYRYCVTANKPKACSAALYYNGGNSAYNPLCIYFTASPEEAESFETMLSLRICEGTKWKVKLNGADYYTNFWDKAATTWSIYSIPFPAGTLRPGQNEIAIQLPSTNPSWTKLDAMKLTLTEQWPCSLWPHPYDGLLLLVK